MILDSPWLWLHAIRQLFDYDSETRYQAQMYLMGQFEHVQMYVVPTLLILAVFCLFYQGLKWSDRRSTYRR